MRFTALAVAALGAAVTLVPATQAAADPVSSCSSTTGTIVAVDFHHWGGPIVRGCDRTNPKRGIDLLDDEGFRTTGTQHDGPLFLCRIGNEAYAGGTQYPTPAQDPCVATPPASAYWSYWLAPAGKNTWSYSQLGAFSDTPKPGEVQLWIFGGTHIQGSQGNPTDGFPVCTPNSLRAGGSPTSCTPSSSSGGSHSTSAPTPPRSSTATSKAPRRGHGSSAAHRPAASSRAGTTAATTGSSAGTPATSRVTTPGARTPASASSSGDVSITDAQPVGPGPATDVTDGSGAPVAVDAKQASTSTPTGSALPLVLGVGLAALFALGGAWIVWQRRRASE